VDDPTRIPNAIEESLRISGPAQAVWRKAKQDTVLHGVSIAAGDRVSVVLGSANLDEEKFDAASEFEPDRPNVTQHVAFGRGIHTCVGAAAARLEGRLSLEVLTQRLPDLRLADDDGFMFVPSAIQRMARRLYVEWGE
jgi:cytochrome P450